jgi:cobalt-precorrin-7 (C5)-methyltransferase
MALSEPTLTIAGCGPGGADFVTPAVHEAVERADVLIGAERLLALFPYAQAERIALYVPIEKVGAEIADRPGKRIVVLVSGDPGIFSLARPLLQRFGRKACRVIPGLSALQLAFAAVGLDWADARVLSAHGELPRLDPAALAAEKKIAVFAGHRDSLAWAAELGRALPAHVAILCEDLTLPGEAVREVSLGELASAPVGPRALVLFVHRSIWEEGWA